MTTGIWKSFVLWLMATLVVIGGLGWLVSRMLVTPPPNRLVTDTFQMDLADGWTCQVGGIAWTCVPAIGDKSAVAIMAMKYRAPEDNPEAFTEYLRTPKPMTMQDGSTQLSKVEYVKVSRIGDHDWVDALHLGSEIIDYYTRYLTAVTADKAIIVSFSADKDDFERYNSEFERMLASLRIYQRPVSSEATAPSTNETTPTRVR
jgi:hypothetical protein